MRILDQFQQGSLSWHNAKLGRPTASEFGEIMTPAFKAREGQTPETYLYERLAEKITGKVLPNAFSSWSVERGQILEDEARPYFELQKDLTTKAVGFVIGDDERCGCSPDALIVGQKAGLEIKCPFPQTHLRYLAYGVVPAEYVTQVHGSLYVTGYDRWYFMSYHPGLPALILTVERDEEIMGKIADCLAKFYRRFDDVLQLLTNRA